MRGLVALLSLGLVAGCAARPGAEAGLDGMMRIAQRLPAQAAGWVQGRAPQGDAVIGVATPYRLSGTTAWATVFVNHPGAFGAGPLPDGPDSQLAQMSRNTIGTAPGPGAQVLTIEIAGAPTQRCGVFLTGSAMQRSLDYSCATGVAGYLLKIRVTAPLPNDTEQERRALHIMVSVLVANVTSAAAGGGGTGGGTGTGTGKPAPAPGGGAPAPQWVPARPGGPTIRV